MSLKHFRERLEDYMPNKYMRPFACKGNPYKCRIFIVGTNPVTKMAKPFLDTYWSDSEGFLYDKFYADYDAQKPRKGTRPRLEQFVNGARPIRCLETNVYATPSTSMATLPEDKKDTKIFEFLLRGIQPDAIFLFSKPAIQHFQRHFNVDSLYGDRFVTVDVFGHKTHVLRLRPSESNGFELFFRIGFDEVYDIGKKFRKKLSNNEDG